MTFTDDFTALKLAAQERKARNRRFAAETFPRAAALASEHGLLLVCRTDAHYQISHPAGWLINLYPGNQRIMAEPSCGRAPFLDVRPTAEHERAANEAGADLETSWSLMEVVRAAILAIKETK